ncbi:MAG: hypothetical protein V7731_19925 [Amphritea sp.]
MNQTPRHFVENRNKKEDTSSNADKPQQRIKYVRNSSGGATRIFFNLTELDTDTDSD